MSSESSASGLCSTCANAPDCMYYKHRGYQAVYCNEFTTNGNTTAASGHELSPGDTRRSSPESEIKGLCLTCANNETCTFPRSAGGVWHCEEYSEEADATRA